MNQTEQAAMALLEKRGFRVIRNGWPDFLCVSKHGIMAVEVKSTKDKLSPNQTVVHALLQSARVPVYVLRSPFDSNDSQAFKTKKFLTSDELMNLRGKVTALTIQMNNLQYETELIKSIIQEAECIFEKLPTPQQLELKAASEALLGTAEIAKQAEENK